MTTTTPEPTATPDAPEKPRPRSRLRTALARLPQPGEGRRDAWTPPSRPEPRPALPRRSPAPELPHRESTPPTGPSRMARLLLVGGIATAVLGPATVAGVVTTVSGTAGRLIAMAPELLPALVDGFQSWEPPGAGGVPEPPSNPPR